MIAGFQLDQASLLACADASLTLAEIEAALAETGLTIGLAAADFDLHRHQRLGTWLAEGAHGAPDPWLDPADHLVAGLDATLPDGSSLSVRPAPRRATGPDLLALSLGARGRFVQIARVWLRVHPRGVPRPETAPFIAERNPPVSPEEEVLLAAIEKELDEMSRAPGAPEGEMSDPAKIAGDPRVA